MKKLLALLLAVLMVCGLAGCGGETTKEPEPEVAEEIELEPLSVTSEGIKVTPEELRDRLNHKNKLMAAEIQEESLESGKIFTLEGRLLHGVRVRLGYIDGSERAYMIAVLEPEEPHPAEYEDFEFDMMVIYVLQAIGTETEDFVAEASVLTLINREGIVSKDNLIGDSLAVLCINGGLAILSKDEVLNAYNSSESETEPEPPVATETMGQKNAVKTAKDYLKFTSFSRTGLIDQLKYEGYSTEDATYAVDKIDPDWNEQAAKKAQEYLDYSSFSRSGLISQLKYEGFTTEQAEYGVSAVGY